MRSGDTEGVKPWRVTVVKRRARVTYPPTRRGARASPCRTQWPQRAGATARALQYQSVRKAAKIFGAGERRAAAGGGRVACARPAWSASATLCFRKWLPQAQRDAHASVRCQNPLLSPVAFQSPPVSAAPLHSTPRKPPVFQLRAITPPSALPSPASTPPPVPPSPTLAHPPHLQPPPPPVFPPFFAVPTSDLPRPLCCSFALFDFSFVAPRSAVFLTRPFARRLFTCSRPPTHRHPLPLFRACLSSFLPLCEKTHTRARPFPPLSAHPLPANPAPPFCPFSGSLPHPSSSPPATQNGNGP